jgi:methylated-DNA-protein-cysteine methyltransferase-like protein
MNDAAYDRSIEEQVYALVRAIPPGRVSSYGAIGAQCSPPISGYICGRIMQNIPDEVPWWRVVGKNGNLPISKRTPEYSSKQRKLLEEEGVGFDDKGNVRMTEFAVGARQLGLKL